LRGDSRSGKTHFLVKLSATLRSLGKYPRLFEGKEVINWMQSLTSSTEIESDEILIVDDFDTLRFEQGGVQESGLFVQAIERLRLFRIPLLISSTRHLEELYTDDHVGSRLREMTQLGIQSPSRDELQEIVRLMAKQRGLKLNARKLAFLEKRMPSSIDRVELYLSRLQELIRLRGASVDFSTLEDALCAELE
jgi:chromosomal replication initiation ATPase DnaA